MAGYVEWGALGGLIAVGLLAVVLLVAKGPQRLAPFAMGTAITSFAVFATLFLIPVTLGVEETPAMAAGVQVVRIITVTSYFVLAVVYPHWRVDSGRRWAVLWALIPGASVIAGLVVVPRLFLSPDGSPTSFFFELGAVLQGFALLAVVFSFASQWVRVEPGPYRRQFLYVILPFILWNVNDSINEATPGDVRFGHAGTTPALYWLGVVRLLAIVAFAGLVLARSPRHVGAERRDDLTLVAWTVVSFPFALLQNIQLYPDMSRTALHIIVDDFGAFLMFYGAARYHVFDIDLKLKLGIRGGALGGTALVIVLIVEQAVQQFVGTTFGLAAGAIVAGIAIFTLTPLQRAAERLSERAMPEVGATEAYMTYRRLELYKVAFEGMLRDGVAEPSETRALKGLRTELGVSDAEHALLEREVRTKLGVGAVPH